jgi:hypothetical protein
MAAGDAFTWTPNKVKTDEPEFPVVVTEAESFKKVTALIDVDENMRWQLLFKNASLADRNAILAHFRDQSGGYFPFSWTTVPAYVEAGANQTVRYKIEGGYNETPLDHYKFRLVITLELVV